MGDQGVSAFVGSLYVDANGRMHVRNANIQGADAGVSIGGRSTESSAGIRVEGSRPVDIANSDISGNKVGVEALENGRGVVRNSRVENNEVADFAFHDESQVRVVQTYAEDLFELTTGRFSTVDSNLNFISERILSASNPQEAITWVARLKRQYESVPDFLKSGAKWEIVMRILEASGLSL